MHAGAAQGGFGRARVRAHAKLNLALRILGRRADGYHELETIFHNVSLADDVEATLTDGRGVQLEMHAGEGFNGVFPAARDNSVVLAASRLTEHTGVARGTFVRIVKRIPIGAGLAGGSVDAAAALVVLNRLWETNLSEAELARIGLKIGSDVPYCLSGGTVLATGRGEKLTPVPCGEEMWFVLALSDSPLYSNEVYDRWDRLAPSPGPPVAALATALATGEAAEVAQLLSNDLEPPAVALRPELPGKKRLLAEAGALGAGLSGSGPTLFACAADESRAGAIADEVRRHFDKVAVVTSKPRSIEPEQ